MVESRGRAHRSLSAEAALLLACIDTSRTQEEKDALIANLLRRCMDWSRFSRMTMTHRLVSLVCRNLGSGPAPNGVPFEIFAGLRFCYLSNALKSDQSAVELVELMREFDAAGLPALVLKGPALSLMVYGDVSTRDYFDIDILVRRADAVAACELMISAGFRARTYNREAFESGFFRNTSDEFSSDRINRLIDLHWKTRAWYFPFGPDEDRLWSRTERVLLKGYRLRTLGAADHVLFLCAHASKHGWPDLASVADIAGLLRARPDLDLRTLIEEAARLRLRRIVLLGLSLAHRLAGAALPEDILGIIRGHRVVCALREQISAQLLSRLEPPTELRKWMVVLRTLELPRDRLRLLLSLGLTPTGGDHARLGLPRALYPLYYLMRPLRLTGTAIAMMARRVAGLDGRPADGSGETETARAAH